MPVSRKDFQVTRLMETLVFGAFIHPLPVKWGMRELGTEGEKGCRILGRLRIRALYQFCKCFYVLDSQHFCASEVYGRGL